MARPPLILSFDIEISDVDLGYYESVGFRVAQHPSETDRRLIMRVIAWCLHASEGIQMAKGGLSNGEQPALHKEDPSGKMITWIDVGMPEGARLHRASKHADQVVVYSYGRTSPWLSKLRKERIHNAEMIKVFTVPQEALDTLAELLERRNQWSLLRQDDELLVTLRNQNVSFPVTALALVTS